MKLPGATAFRQNRQQQRSPQRSLPFRPTKFYTFSFNNGDSIVSVAERQSIILFSMSPVVKLAVKVTWTKQKIMIVKEMLDQAIKWSFIKTNR